MIAIIAIAPSCSNMEGITGLLNKDSDADLWNGYDHFNAKNMTAILYADMNLEVGTVTFGLEEVGDYGYLTATYQLKNGWEMTESQLYVGPKDKMPAIDPENPDRQKFPYVEEHMPRVTSYTQYVLCNELPPLQPGVKVAAQTFIRNFDGQKETAFADGQNDMLTAL